MGIQTLEGLLRRLGEICFLIAVFSLPFSKGVLETFLFLTFVLWFAEKIVGGRPLCTDQILILILGLLVISSSQSAFHSGYPWTAARGIIKLTKYILVMLVGCDLFRDPKSLKRLLLVLFFSCCIVLIDVAFQQITGKDFVSQIPLHYTDEQARVTGPFRSYGLLAALLIAVTPVFGALVLGHTERRVRLASLGLVTFALYFLYHTHSRGAWLAAFGSGFVFAVMIRKKAMLLILVTMLLAAPFVLPRNALIHLDMNQKEQSLIERFDLWNRAIQVIQKKPWFGCGINTYSKNYVRFNKKMSWRVPGYSVHNGYLQTAAETGLVSLFLLMVVISKSLVSGYQAFRNAQDHRRLFVSGLITGLVALLLQAGFDTTLHNPQSAVLIWLFMSLLFAVNDISRVGKI